MILKNILVTYHSYISWWKVIIILLTDSDLGGDYAFLSGKENKLVKLTKNTKDNMSGLLQ